MEKGREKYRNSSVGDQLQPAPYKPSSPVFQLSITRQWNLTQPAAISEMFPSETGYPVAKRLSRDSPHMVTSGFPHTAPHPVTFRFCYFESPNRIPTVLHFALFSAPTMTVSLKIAVLALVLRVQTGRHAQNLRKASVRKFARSSI